MRIQHNILAMNSYRNYTNNTNALGKNLEKLSSGYKINRAGDDAAGLAISEKMRAQIQGLNAAQKNVKDAISFVKTAEGAMQEIQDMLSRMKYLATQSANGTYQDDVDREALQDEVNSLLEEIDRIAQAANFNGIYMLNGGGGGGGTATPTVDLGSNAASVAVTFAFGSKVSDDVKAAINKALGEGVDFTIKASSAQGSVTVDLSDLLKALGDGYKATAGTSGSITLDGPTNVGKGSIAITISDADGNEVATIKIGAAQIKAATTTATLSAGKDLKATFDDEDALAAAGLGSISFDGLTDKVKSIEIVFASSGAASVAATFADGKLTITISEGASFATSASAALSKINAAIASAVASESSLSGLKMTGTIDVEKLKAAKEGTKLTATVEEGGGGGSYSIDMQIGDSSAGFDTMNIKIQSMRTTSIGVSGLSIANISDAHAAIDIVKDAIDTVSSVRGQLGAYQNRLEHTQNNLSVMTENIQDAESTIRDTDVADEMMGYVKNNILVQSAQAMLAQANQVPQGVLQLLG